MLIEHQPNFLWSQSVVATLILALAKPFSIVPHRQEKHEQGCSDWDLDLDDFGKTEVW